MSKQYKIYVEAYERVYELLDPQFHDDGDITSSKWRQVGHLAWHEDHGTFLDAKVFENGDDAVNKLLDLLDTQGCDLPECCGEPEDCAQQPTTNPEDDEFLIDNFAFHDEGEPCCGADEQCSDCPENITAEHGLLYVTARGFSGQIADALNVLIDIAQDDGASDDVRVEAAGAVVTTYLRAFGV